MTSESDGWLVKVRPEEAEVTPLVGAFLVLESTATPTGLK
jgi:hypothetical protein